MSYGWIEYTIERSISNPIAKFTGTINSLDAPGRGDRLTITALDHNDVERCLFVGFVADVFIDDTPAHNKSSITAYGYPWYLSNSYFVLDWLDIDTYEGETWTPKKWINYCIGNNTTASAWKTTTRVYPYRILSPDDAGHSAADCTGIFGESNETRYAFLQKLGKRTGQFFHDKYIAGISGEPPGEYVTCGYWICTEDIDTASYGLDLPDPVTVYAHDPYLMSPINRIKDETKKINRVIVQATGSDTGEFAYDVVDSAELTAGLELPVEYLEINPDLTTEAECTTRATALLAQMNATVKKYDISFVDRVDLELYQKVMLAGYTGISPEYYRITAIKYQVSAGKKIVSCTISDEYNSDGASKLSDSERKQDDTQIGKITSAVKTIVLDTLRKTPNAKIGKSEPLIGIVKSTDGHTGVITTDFGHDIENVRVPAGIIDTDDGVILQSVNGKYVAIPAYTSLKYGTVTEVTDEETVVVTYQEDGKPDKEYEDVFCPAGTDYVEPPP